MDVLHALVLARAKKGRKGVSMGDNKAEVEALAGVIYFASPGFLTSQSHTIVNLCSTSQ